MTINITQTLSNNAYNQLLAKYIGIVEGDEFLPYVDTVGVPTIGWGYALNKKHAAPGVVDYIIKYVVGVDPGRNNLSLTAVAQEKAFHDELAAIFNEKWPLDNTKHHTGSSVYLQQALNQILAARANDIRLHINGYTVNDYNLLNSIGINTIFGFTSEDQISEVFRIVQYGTDPDHTGMEGTITSFTTKYGINITDSNERIAIFSMVYQGSFNKTFQKQLASAMNISDPDEARARAWYLIRYTDFVSGRAPWRAYMESAMFGLYSPGQPVDEAEALAIYRMYTKYADDINIHDNNYASDIKTANGMLSKLPSGTVIVPTADLTSNLQAAAYVLNSEYGHGVSYSPLNIFVADSSGKIDRDHDTKNSP